LGDNKRGLEGRKLPEVSLERGLHFLGSLGAKSFGAKVLRTLPEPKVTLGSLTSREGSDADRAASGNAMKSLTAACGNVAKALSTSFTEVLSF
jgi:hypothetical protein